MMFNYDAESNAMSILRAMSRETVPSRCIQPSPSKNDQHWLIGYYDFMIIFKITSLTHCIADWLIL